MEWVAVALGVAVVIVLGFWAVRRRSGTQATPGHQINHTGSQSTRGVEDSMSVRLPTGGNSGL